MPNYKGTRGGLGFMRECVCCGKEYEIFSARQKRCHECNIKGKQYVNI